MNLMFRKNFREQKSGLSTKAAKACASRHTSKRSSREGGYTPIEEHHYRTHLFFSPPRSSYAQSAEEIDGRAAFLSMFLLLLFFLLPTPHPVQKHCNACF
ncbi:hypothetical protein Zmor_000932 [Zophobas morio]|uniref:Uncharacterized protein n=1 Tax=Zophobas morio TaxID=2755281 RepID=A0AA38MR64_9CUCU|nr:hypothetical protein Zmor_000932 [Zophobas morio]